MDKENMKNMVILKDLPSNILEEAIIILKPNVKLKNLDLNANKKNSKIKKKEEQNPKKYIIDEAEMIVNNYLSTIENNKKNDYKFNKKLQNKYKRLRVIAILFGFLFFISFLL